MQGREEICVSQHFLEEQNIENMTFSKYMEWAYQDDLKAVAS